MHSAANNSNMMLITESSSYFYDSDLNVVQQYLLNNEIDEHIQGEVIYDVKMSESHLFILYANQRLKIFNLTPLDLVKAICVDGQRIKLISSRYLALFDFYEQTLYLYYQVKDLLEKELHLNKSIWTGLLLARDKTETVSFFDRTHIKWKLFYRINKYF